MAVSFQTSGMAVCFIAAVLPALLVVGQPAAPPTQGVPSQTCNPGGAYQSFGDSSDCKNFFICSHGTPMFRTCPANLHFSEDSKVCVWPYTYQDDCARNNAVRECSGPCTGRIAHPTDCKSYYDCSDTSNTPASFGPKECPGANMYFDYVHLQCVHFLDVKCGPGRQGPCFGDSCYLRKDTNDDWKTSQQFCKAKGGNLAAIESAEENQFIQNLFSGISGNHWLGGSDIANEGVWRWLPDNTVATYLNWQAGQPNNDDNEGDCMLMLFSTGRWYDRQCDDTSFAVCEFKK